MLVVWLYFGLGSSTLTKRFHAILEENDLISGDQSLDFTCLWESIYSKGNMLRNTIFTVLLKLKQLELFWTPLLIVRRAPRGKNFQNFCWTVKLCVIHLGTLPAIRRSGEISSSYCRRRKKFSAPCFSTCCLHYIYYVCQNSWNSVCVCVCVSALLFSFAWLSKTRLEVPASNLYCIYNPLEKIKFEKQSKWDKHTVIH